MKAIDELVNTCTGFKNVGNHSVINKKDNTSWYSYHNHIICIANHTDKTVEFSTCGLDTRSTNRAINCYRKHYADYMEVTQDERED